MTFLTNNTPLYKLYRTILQGVISWLMTEIPDILGLFHVDPTLQAILIPLFMAILSPIMAYLGEAMEDDALALGAYEEDDEEEIDGEDEENDEEEDA